jgi:lysozyme family protein
MSGRADSEPPAEPADTEYDATETAARPADAADPDDPADAQDDPVSEARRARWTAVGAGGLLTLAGLAAALLRLSGPVPPLVPAAYALGAAVCAGAAVLGAGGRTRRALWLLITGLMVMALGDQFD